MQQRVNLLAGAAPPAFPPDPFGSDHSPDPQRRQACEVAFAVMPHRVGKAGDVDARRVVRGQQDPQPVAIGHGPEDFRPAVDDLGAGGPHRRGPPPEVAMKDRGGSPIHHLLAP